MSLQICKVGSSDTVVDNRETDVTSSRRKIAMGARDPLAAAGGQLSWVDRHRPSRSSDLPVHHSKVKAVREWLNRCVVNGRRDGHAPPSILVLCGMSGCCKSSLVELLCREMTVQVHEWSDDCWEGDARLRNHSPSTAVSSSSSHDLFTLVGVTRNAWTNKAEVMQDFTRRCQYPSLECVRKASSSHRHPPGTGFLDGSSRRRTATGEGTKLTRSSSSSNNTIRHLSTARGPTDDSSIENCSSDEDTTTTAAAAACYPSSPRVAPPSRSAGTLILLHDPLSHYSQQRTGASQHLEGVHRFLLSSPCPVVLVVSEVDARDEHCVDQYVPTSIRQRVDFQSIHFPAITDIKMTKVLSTIVSSELGGRVLADPATIRAVRSVAGSSQGDVRHAIVQLQLVLSTAPLPRLQPLPLGSKVGAGVGKGISDGAADIFPRRKRHKPTSLPPCVEGAESTSAVTTGTADPPLVGANAGSTTASDRDACYSSMHSVGKLLHAKLDRCGAMSFDPDSAAACSELSLSALSDLLQWNVPGRLMDEQRRIGLDCCDMGDSNSDMALRELNALDGLHSIFSDEDLLAARKYDPVGGGDECFSEAYSIAILSRATAVVRGTGSRERAEQVKQLGLSNSFVPIRGSQVSRLRSRLLHLRHNLRAVQEQLFEWLSTSPGTHLSGCSPTGHLSLRELTLCVLPLQRHITSRLGPSSSAEGQLPPDLSRLMINIYNCREQASYRGPAALPADHSAEEQVLVDSIVE